MHCPSSFDWIKRVADKSHDAFVSCNRQADETAITDATISSPSSEANVGDVDDGSGGGGDDVAATTTKMSKLYIGNLAAEANEAALRQLLQESGIGNVSSVLVKRGGYAFIDCPEQSTVERAIEKLNGTFLFSIASLFHYY